jgi:pullulanase/glycogen debranching enzyme
MTDWTALEGSAFPLGATWLESAQAWNFALYSKHAEGVTLLCYAPSDLVTPVLTYRLDYLRNKSGRIWHCRVPQADLCGACYYAYSVAGPEPQGRFEWHCFDPEKVLLDPYAKSVFFPPAFDRAAASRSGSNAGKAPLGRLVGAGEVFDWGEDRRPRHQSDTVIYELHVRGFTSSPNSGVSPERRGTYGGVAEKIPYLQDLGVTAVELMPIFQFDPHEGNYWGYMPLSFFAPHHGYGSRWNGRFRDDVRRFVRGEPGLVPALMQRLYGSDDLFPDDRLHAFHPYQSINYVTAHDGFTLYDLMSYDRKRNQANGHDNADGPEENYSWNCGWEGDQGVPAQILQLRRRQAKNFCCLLLLANGTPMLRAGDEFLQTQDGNNNPYNQDNVTSWLDWDRLRVNQDVFRFIRCMIRFRQAHPSLGRSRFWRDDVRWFGPGPTVDMSPASRTLAVYLCGASQQDADVYVMINASDGDVTFQIQEGRPGEWRQAFDTGLVSPDDFQESADGPCVQSLSYVVRSRSVVGLIR